MGLFNFKKITASLLLALVLVWTMPAQAAITFTTSNVVGPYSVGGNSKMATGKMNLAGTYATEGFTLSPSKFGMSSIQQVIVQAEDGYTFFYNGSTGKVMVFQGASATPTGSNSSDSAGTPAGTVAAPIFTGNALAVHGHNVQNTQDEVLSVTAGTGVSSALANIPVGAVDSVYITAGGVTGAAVMVPVGSVANSKEVSVNYTTGVLQFLVADAVTAAKVTYARAAVSTTSAGTPAGTNSVPAFTGNALAAHTHTFTGVAGGGGAESEVANGTNLGSVDQVNYVVIGN